MKKYLFAFDLDGTLLNTDESISVSTNDGLKKLREMGHEVCIITGRSWNMMKNIYKDTQMVTPAGVFNGAVVKAGSDHSYETTINHLEIDLVKKLIDDELFKDHIESYVVESTAETYVSDLNSNGANLVRRWAGVEPKSIGNSKEFIDVVAVLAELNTKDDEVANQIVKSLKDKYPYFEISHWYSSHTETINLEATRKDSRKDFALRKIANHLNVPMNRTIAFGDGNNDIHMLMVADRGVSMLNAKSSVKKFSDETTEYANSQDGAIIHALKIADELRNTENDKN